MPIAPSLEFRDAGLTFIQRYWWDEQIIQHLGQFLWHFLAENEGSAWFRTGDGSWIAATGDGLAAIEQALKDEVAAWHTDDLASFADYQRLNEQHRWALFMDSRRFRACINEPETVPGDYFIGFAADWRWNQSADAVFTPHFRVTTSWPESMLWAPPVLEDARPEQPPLRVEDLGRTLWQTFWINIEDRFRELQFAAQIYSARLELGGKPQTPSVFFHLVPTTPMTAVDDLLTDEMAETMNIVASELLRSPDLRSTEITGGVMEGTIATFNHRPSYTSEYSLFIPLGTTGRAQTESTISFITGYWQEYDFDATWVVYKSLRGLPIGEHRHRLWNASLTTVLEMSAPLLTMLSKDEVQERVFPFVHRLSGFLARLQIKAFNEDQISQQTQSTLSEAVQETRRFSDSKFTVRPIAGLELPKNIDQGYPRAFEFFNQQLTEAAKQAEMLPQQIEHAGQLLTHAARFEEQKYERTQQRMMEREEQSAKLLNKVLAVVAVLAAIPLLVGEFETGAIATALSHLGFGESFSHWFGEFGLHFSFWSALIAFALTVWALFKAMRRQNLAAPEQVGRVARIDKLSQTLFDVYRQHDHHRIDQASTVISVGCQRGARLWSEGDDEVRAARTQIHQLDLELAHVTLDIMEQCRQWLPPQHVPADDEAWVSAMEQRVGRFLLLSNLYDLKPRILEFPISITLLNFCFRLAGMGGSPISDQEYERVMGYYGYTPEEIEAIAAWAGSQEVQSLSGAEILDAMEARGINALHNATIS